MKLNPQLYRLGLCPLVLVSSCGEENDKNPVALGLEKWGGGATRHAALLMHVTDYRCTLLGLPSGGYRVSFSISVTFPHICILRERGEGAQVPLKLQRSCFVSWNGAAI